jgi:hypothetical protein
MAVSILFLFYLDMIIYVKHGAEVTLESVQKKKFEQKQ